MLSRFELSILYLLQSASRLIGDPGNFSLAKSNVSTFHFLIFFFLKFLIHYLNELNQIQHYE